MTKSIFLLFSVLFLTSPLHASSNKSVDDLYDIQQKLESLFQYTKDNEGDSTLRKLQKSVSGITDSISKAEKVGERILFLTASVEDLFPLLKESAGDNLRSIQEKLSNIKKGKEIGVLMQIGMDIEKLFLSIEDQKADGKLRDIQMEMSDISAVIHKANKASKKALLLQIDIENLFVVLKEGAGDTLRDIQELLGNIK